MLSAFRNMFKVPELRKRIIFTLALLIVYRIGGHIPTPGVDGGALARALAKAAGGTLFGLVDLFSGGAFNNFTIFALGIMPYISSSIILQLLIPVVPFLEKLSKEGELGRRKLNQYTRYGTVVLCVLQSFFISMGLEHPERLGLGNLQLVADPGWAFRFMTVITLTTGTTFIMWLGEQINDRGIGNGISLIIFAGIISRLPSATRQVIALLSAGQMNFFTFLLLLGIMVGVIAGVIVLTQAQRKIPVQYAKRIIGRKVYGGQSTYIPLRVNQAGVIPIIFASSMLMFPSTLAQFAPTTLMQGVSNALSPNGGLYQFIYFGLIMFFCYFYTAITFNPIELADNMKKSGSFVPGIRPGKPTAEYFYNVMNRITLAGSIALASVAILPRIISSGMKIPYLVASFMGGTGLLIVVGVALDTMKQIESHLIARHYEGFMKKGKLKSRR